MPGMLVSKYSLTDVHCIRWKRGRIAVSALEEQQPEPDHLTAPYRKARCKGANGTERPLHDPGVRRARWMQHRQHLVAAVDQLLQSCGAGIAHRFPPYGWHMVAPAGMLVERQFPR